MSTVAEIKSAIEKLSPNERVELESLIWPDWDRAEGDTPPNIHEKLRAAAKGTFVLGSGSNSRRVIESLK